MSAIEKVITAAGSVAELANLIGEKPQTVQHWRKRGVPANKCLLVASAIKGVTSCHELRPDVFPPISSKKPKTAAA